MPINFATAPVVTAPAKSAKGTDRNRVFTPDLEKLAALDETIKSLQAQKDEIEAAIKGTMAIHFAITGCEKKAKPDSYRGFDGAAEASLEFRRRSSKSPLSEAEQILLTEHNIPFSTVASQVETFIINPAYANDAALLDRVAKKLNTIKDIPEDFIQKQPGRDSKVVSDDTVSALFKLPVEIVGKLLSLVSTLAIKPKLTDYTRAAKLVGDLLAVEAPVIESPAPAVPAAKSRSKKLLEAA